MRDCRMASQIRSEHRVNARASMGFSSVLTAHKMPLLSTIVPSALTNLRHPPWMKNTTFVCRTAPGSSAAHTWP